MCSRSPQYRRQVSKKPVSYDVVDGQQRIRAICEFCDGKYGLPKDADPIDGFEVKGMRHDDLPHELRIKWDTYNLDIVVMEGQRAPFGRTIVRRFQSARTRALFAGLAAHSFPSLDEPVSGAFGMLMAVPAHAVGWPIPRGGLLNTHAATQKPCPHK